MHKIIIAYIIFLCLRRERMYVTYENPCRSLVYNKLGYFDVRVTDVDAKSNRSKAANKVLAGHEREKRRNASPRATSALFPFVASTGADGLLGKEVKTLLKRLGALLAENGRHPSRCSHEH
jgi:hypothetical protein